jgi:hypothetical protein
MDSPFSETFSSWTVPENRFRWSVLFGLQKRLDKGYLNSLPRISYTAGLGSSTDLQVSWEYLMLKNAFYFPDNSGPGDVRLRLRTGLFQSRNSKTSMYMVTKLPDADEIKGLGTDQTDFHWGFGYTRKNSAFNVSVNAGIGILGKPEVDNRPDMIYLENLNFYTLASTVNNPGKGDYREITGQTDVLDYGLMVHLFPLQKNSFIFEIKGFKDSEKVYKQACQARAGVICKTKADNLVSIFAGSGINGGTPDKSLFIGYSFRDF